MLGLAAGYALTDRFELELGVLVPFVADAAMKLNLLRSARFRAALVTAMDVPLVNFGPPLFRGGLTGQLCLSNECWSSLSLTLMAGAGRTDLLPERYGVLGSAGAIIAVSRVVKVSVEPTLVCVPGNAKESTLQWGAGLRLGHERWALDVGFEVVPSATTDSFPVWPLIAFTWRTLPSP